MLTSVLMVEMTTVLTEMRPFDLAVYTKMLNALPKEPG
jgi:hypothetical protein